ncbi:hypothetical protein IU433_18840 [Nocardia puris]|nr:hypothetical protein [Nocardia puris]MBF6366751.1 hypothetical protein [Nocardia puris]MBF6461093.1 hypothetical protein [Nocardia puris]
MRFRGLSTTLIAVTAATCVGCASTIAGNPSPGLTPVDIESLATGVFTPEPTAYDPDYSIPLIRRLDAYRILAKLVHSYEVDPEIDELGTIEVFESPGVMIQEDTFPPKYERASVDNRLLSGVYVSRINDSLRSRKKLIISVLRFPTEELSRKAAVDFDQITNDEPGRHVIPIDGYPTALTSSADDITAISFIAHGPYVIMVNAGIPQPDQAALAEVLRKTLSLQIPRIDELEIIPLDEILDSPIDPDGILRRALPPASDYKDYSDPFKGDRDFGALAPSAQLHFVRNPAAAKQAFDEAGVDLVARRGGVVYRTRDLEASFALQSALMKAEQNDEELPPPPGLPDVRCLLLEELDPARSYNTMCAVVFGRYVAVVYWALPYYSRSTANLYERAAAQYAILARSE